jgi:hypothetical protein
VNSNVNLVEANFHDNNANHAIKKSKSGEFNAADLRNSLDRKINGLMYGTKNLSNENLLLDSSSTSSVSSSCNTNTLTSNSPVGRGPFPTTRRNVVMNYTEMESKIRETTNDEV